MLKALTYARIKIIEIARANTMLIYGTLVFEIFFEDGAL